MTPEESLRQIPGFSQAPIVRQIAAGPVSDGFLVEHAGGQYVLRIDRPIAATLGLDRDAEATIAGAMGEQGIGPRLEFADPGSGVLVSEYLPGRSWVVSDLDDPENLRRLAGMLRRLHGLQAIGKPFALRSNLTHYAGLVGTAEAQQMAGEADVLLRRLSADDSRLCLCHNDLNSANILDSGSLHLIDWEYAAIGDPCFDLATVIQHHGLTEEQAEGLLTAYQGPVSDEDRHHLGRYRRVYDRLLALWLLALGCSMDLALEQAEQLAGVRARIAQGPLL
jgi:thiamine kinase